MIYANRPIVGAGVTCTDTDKAPFHRCGPCPTGMMGNGTVCTDQDEVNEFNLIF